MKRLLVCLVMVTAIVLLVVWRSHSRQSSTRAHGDYHQCQVSREELDMARYWYALDNGLTDAPGLPMEALAPYVQGERPPACPGGGAYSVSPANQRVACSIPDHMLDTCKGNHEPPDKPMHWDQEYPLDYRASEQWRQSMGASKDGTILRMSGATLLFKGLHNLGASWGTMQVSGAGTSQGSSSAGDISVSISYANGTYTMAIAGHVLLVADGGRTLQIDGSTVDLSGARPRIVVETNGLVRVDS